MIGVGDGEYIMTVGDGKMDGCCVVMGEWSVVVESDGERGEEVNTYLKQTHKRKT